MITAFFGVKVLAVIIALSFLATMIGWKKVIVGTSVLLFIYWIVS